MFKRRHKPKWTESFRNFVWPKIGWGRWMQYYTHRVGRLGDSPYRLAAGLACGVAVSFTPFIGFHVLLAVFVAFILRANMFAAAIGTILGNPWTFPFIWALTYNIGTHFSEADHISSFSEIIDGDKLLSHPLDALEPVLSPMMFGGAIVGVIVGWICYFVFYQLIITYRKKRQVRFERRQHKLDKENSFAEDEDFE